MNEAVKKILERNTWSLATMGEAPNVVPIGMTCITADGKLLLGDVMMETSAANVRATGKAAVCAWDPKTGEGYQVKGSAVYETDGPLYAQFNAAAVKQTGGAMHLKGIIVLTPEQEIVVTPGPDNKKVL